MAYDEHPTHVLAAGAIFIAVCTIIVTLRFYTRALQKAEIGIDDWLVLPALVCEYPSHGGQHVCSMLIP